MIRRYINWIFLFILLATILQCLTFGQTLMEKSANDSAKNNFNDNNITTKKELGSWLAIKSGFQLNGGPLSERYAIIVGYDFRHSAAFSLSGEFHLWKNSSFQWNGAEYIKNIKTLIVVSIAPKIICKVGIFNLTFESGVGIGVEWAPISFHYGTSIEYILNDRFLLSVSQKRYAYPELNHFVVVGFLINTNSSH